MKPRPWQWVATGIASGALLIGIGLVDRNHQIDRLDTATCNNYNTLYNLIVQQAASVDTLRRLGFTEQQIDILVEASERNKQRQLRTLGPRHAGCEPGEVR